MLFQSSIAQAFADSMRRDPYEVCAEYLDYLDDFQSERGLIQYTFSDGSVYEVYEIVSCVGPFLGFFHRVV